MQKRIFTLLELLIVVAVIAILAGLLLPALNKARESAIAIKCTESMKQLGLAYHQYAQICDNWTLTYDTPRWYINECFLEILKVRVKGPSGWNLEYWDKSFICANATRCGTNATLYKTLSPLYRSVCNAYGLNVSGTEGPSWTNYKLTKVRNSSAKVAFSETSAGGLIPSWSRDPAGTWWLLGNGQLTDTDQYMAYRHRENTAANTLFFDSHVATIPYSVFMQSQFSYNLTPYQ